MEIFKNKKKQSIIRDEKSLRKILSRFGMDTISLSGTLENKLQAMQEVGFNQVMLKANDLTTHNLGLKIAVSKALDSKLNITGFQVLRDFEGLFGDLHDYKIEVAKGMLEMGKMIGSKLLLVCSSTSAHAVGDYDKIIKDLRKLANLALPLGIKIVYEALSWGRFVNEYTQSWEIIKEANHPNLGICLDSFHILASKTKLDSIYEKIEAEKIFLVQLADFLWQETKTFEEKIATARTYRVFPGEGVHTKQIIQIMQFLKAINYQGNFSFEVFNDDYQQLPLSLVCTRAKNSALWLAEEILHNSSNLPSNFYEKLV